MFLDLMVLHNVILQGLSFSFWTCLRILHYFKGKEEISRQKHIEG